MHTVLRAFELVVLRLQSLQLDTDVLQRRLTRSQSLQIVARFDTSTLNENAKLVDQRID